MFETQPISYMSSGAGSSLAADFCATSRMLLPASIAISMALIDFGRPTNKGMTMCGKTTTSRSGSSGNSAGMAESSLELDMLLPPRRNSTEHGGVCLNVQAKLSGVAFESCRNAHSITADVDLG